MSTSRTMTNRWRNPVILFATLSWASITAFGDSTYAQHVRISFSGVSDAVLAESLERMINGVLLRQQAAS